jgi:hypothetical protein
VTGIVNLFSGSAKQNKLKPRQYKYAAERNFLDDSFTFEERSDSMGVNDSNDEDFNEVNLQCKLTY